MFKRQALTILLLAVVAVSGAFGPRALAEKVLAQGTGPELAVYNQGIALVKEARTLTLAQGVQPVTITDVAAQIDPTSVHFKSLTDPAGTTVLEQNFEYDLVGADKLLSKYVDQPIQLITNDGAAYEGALLNGSGDIILQDKDGQVLVVNRGSVRDFTFPKLPEGLITRPSLVWLVDAQEAGEQRAEITYMTNGIGWQANYVLLLARDDQTLDLNGWITLDNHSGATYRDAKLKLIAGDINQVRQGQPEQVYKVMAEVAAPTPQVAERGFFEYHLYEVQRPVTIKDNQTKQIEFVTATGVPAEKFFVYDGAQGYSFWGGLQTDPGYGADTDVKQVKTMLQFDTGEEGVNAQLPKGVVRVYQADVDGSALLVGEDIIEHTPKDENVRLYIGDAFDIVGERIQTNFAQLGDKTIEESYEITVRNHKAEAVQVRVVEHLYRWSDWEIVAESAEESAEHTRLDAQTVEWRLDVPADGEAKVTYTVRYRW